MNQISLSKYMQKCYQKQGSEWCNGILEKSRFFSYRCSSIASWLFTDRTKRDLILAQL